jgi:HSP20 family protein
MRIVRYSYPTVRNFAPVLSGFPRSPWSGLESEIDRLFETALGRDVAPVVGRFPVDLFEDNANVYVRAELPGVNRADIGVELIDDQLTLTVTSKVPATEGQPEQSSTFSRSVQIAAEVQAEKVSAACEHGVLTVTLPKREAVQPKKITVAVK